MIPQEREPRPVVTWPILQVPRHRALRHGDAQFQQLAVNPWRAPARVLGRHPLDQIAGFLTRTGPPNPFLHPRAKSPIEAEPRPVPSDHRVWFDDDERIDPPGPDSAHHDPKEPVNGGQSRTWMTARQDRELLPQRQILQRQVTSGAAEGEKPTEHEPESVEHTSPL